MRRKVTFLVRHEAGSLALFYHQLRQLGRQVIRKANMQRRTTTRSTGFQQSIRIRMNQQCHEFFFDHRRQFGVALRNHVQGERTVSVARPSSGRRLLENRRNDLGAFCDIALADNGLMQRRRLDRIVHANRRERQRGMLLENTQDFVPVVVAAFQEERCRWVGKFLEVQERIAA